MSDSLEPLSYVVGEILRLGYDKKALADAVGVHCSQINRWLEGKKPHGKTAFELRKLLTSIRKDLGRE